MAADLQILDSDETTVITSDSLGNVATPGSSAATKYFVQNVGSTEATEVVVTPTAFGTNDGVDFAYLAPDVAGAPGVFSQDPVELGTIAPLDTAPFWAQIVQPAGLTADLNPRRVNAVATGLTV